MPDRWVYALAAAAVSGALLATPVPLLAALGLLGAAFALRRPWLVCLALLLVTSELGHRADAGLQGGPEGEVHAEVLLVSDPRPSGPGLRADARLGRHRVLLRATGPAAEDLAPRLAGEHVQIVGEAEPVVEPAGWLRARHVASTVRVWRVEGWRTGPAVARLANAVRRVLDTGASPLGLQQRSLFTGLVIGDDRQQAPEVADDFRATSLTHLTAVSGQNVALVLVLVAPVLRRMRLWPRLWTTLAVIALFGLITRFEPSVLRASAMAALAVLAATLGRPTDRLRILALALTGLVVIDPLLVEAVGFQLSVAASAGILLLSRPLSRALRGPRVVRDPLAVTVAAQIGVAPVLVATFGPMPLSSVPANLLAVPAKGVVMLWGLTGGLLAGLAGGTVAEVAHVPTRLLVEWIMLVAHRCAALPLGELDGVGVGLVTVGVVLAATMRHRRVVARSGALLVLGVVVVTVAAASAPPPLRASPVPGVVVWRSAGGVAVELSATGGRPPPGTAQVLEEVRRTGARRVDLIVVADARVDEATVDALGRRHGGPPVLVPPGRTARPGEHVVPAPGTTVEVRGLQLRVVVAGPRLSVDGRPVAAAG